MHKIKLTPSTIQSKIFTIRGKQIMLDRDLAELYRVKTMALNQAVKRNAERFPERLRFQLTKEDVNLISQIVISNGKTQIFDSKESNIISQNAANSAKRGGVRKLPYAFTEQGVAMLSAVLRSSTAIQISLQIMDAFVEMRHYLATNADFINQFAGDIDHPPVSQDGLLQLAVQTSRIAAQTSQLTYDMAGLKSNDIERKNELKKIMDYFNDPSTYKHFKLDKGDPLGADLNYAKIYSLAQKNIVLVDNYINVKTLDQMRNVANNVSITILSDQYGRERLTENILDDFRKIRTDLQISLHPANHTFHDRYIFVDYGLPYEKLFLSGASPKDSGKRVSTLVQIEKPELYHNDIKEMLDKN